MLRLAYIYGLVLLLLLCRSAHALSVTKFVGAASDACAGCGAGLDRTWDNPDSLFADDAMYSRASSQFKNGDATRELHATMSGNKFNIPLDLTIVGIEVTLEAQDAATGPAGDSIIQLLKDDTKVGDNKKVETDDWPTTLATKTWGGATDLWGTTWTPAEVNDPDFGIAIKIVEVDNVFTRPEVDYIQITIYYDTARDTLSGTTHFDSWMDEQATSTNYGTSTTMTCKNLLFSNKRGRPWFRFTDIPGAVGPNRIIKEALLEVEVQTVSGSSTIKTFRILRTTIVENEMSWDSVFTGCPSCLAWTTPGAESDGNDYDNTELESIVITATGTNTFDLTDITQKVYNGTYSEFDVVMWNNTVGESVIWYSSEHGTASNRPRLIIKSVAEILGGRGNIHGAVRHGAIR